jgi:hypothetical protein
VKKKVVGDWREKLTPEQIAEIEAIKRKAYEPLTPEELELRRRFWENADRLRVKVDFNIVDEIRKMRGPLG